MTQLSPSLSTHLENRTDKIRVVLMDDHNLLRIGMAAIINQMQGVEVVGQASESAGLKSLLASGVQPDVILMDIGLGNSESGIEVTRWVKNTHASVKVIGLTVSDEQSDIVEIVQAGASGYLLKNTDQHELYTAIVKVADGQSYFTSKVAESLLNRLLTGKQRSSTTRNVEDIELRQVPNANVNLTAREVDILVMVAQEFGTGQIAEALSISPRTVENHRYRLTQKLGVKGAAGLAKYAIKHGLVNNR